MSDPASVGAGSDVVWCHAQGWAVRVLPGRVLMARRGGAKRTLDGLAAAVWLALDEPDTTAGVRDLILSVFQESMLDPEVVGATVEVLAESGIIEPANLPTTPSGPSGDLAT